MPTVLICSTVYQPVASALAKALGVGDLTIATIPHPYSWSGLSREDVKERATGVVDQVLGGLTGKAQPKAAAGR